MNPIPLQPKTQKNAFKPFFKDILLLGKQNLLDVRSVIALTNLTQNENRILSLRNLSNLLNPLKICKETFLVSQYLHHLI